MSKSKRQAKKEAEVKGKVEIKEVGKSQPQKVEVKGKVEAKESNKYPQKEIEVKGKQDTKVSNKQKENEVKGKEVKDKQDTKESSKPHKEPEITETKLTKAEREAANKAARQAENKAEQAAKKAAKEAEKTKKEAELKAQKEIELKAKQAAELKAKQEAAQKEAEFKAKQEAAEKAKAEAKAKKDAELKAQKEAEIKKQAELEAQKMKALDEMAAKSKAEYAAWKAEIAERLAQKETAMKTEIKELSTTLTTLLNNHHTPLKPMSDLGSGGSKPVSSPLKPMSDLGSVGSKNPGISAQSTGGKVSPLKPMSDLGSVGSKDTGTNSPLKPMSDLGSTGTKAGSTSINSSPLKPMDALAPLGAKDTGTKIVDTSHDNQDSNGVMHWENGKDDSNHINYDSDIHQYEYASETFYGDLSSGIIVWENNNQLNFYSAKDEIVGFHSARDVITPNDWMNDNSPTTLPLDPSDYSRNHDDNLTQFFHDWMNAYNTGLVNWMKPYEYAEETIGNGKSIYKPLSDDPYDPMWGAGNPDSVPTHSLSGRGVDIGIGGSQDENQLTFGSDDHDNGNKNESSSSPFLDGHQPVLGPDDFYTNPPDEFNGTVGEYVTVSVNWWEWDDYGNNNGSPYDLGNDNNPQNQLGGEWETLVFKPYEYASETIYGDLDPYHQVYGADGYNPYQNTQ